MEKNNRQRLEVMWGVDILEEGYTQIPNLITFYHRKVGITPGEWSFITLLLTYKHNVKDPYPKAESLAEMLDCTIKQIEKYTNSLKKKGLLKVNRTKSRITGRYGNNVYNFQPLVDAVLELNQANKENQIEEDEYQIIDNEPPLPEVGVETEKSCLSSPTRSRSGSGSTGRDHKKENNKKKIIKENNKSQSVDKLTIPEVVMNAISQNKKLTDRLTDIISVYESVKQHPGYSDGLFILTMNKSIKVQLKKTSFHDYLLRSMLNNFAEFNASIIKPINLYNNDGIPGYIREQIQRSQEEVAVATPNELTEEQKQLAIKLLTELGEIGDLA